MTKVATVAEVREIEAVVDRSVMSYAQMMVNAGLDASACLQRKVDINSETKILFLIGKGNNGGDGLVMAYDLAQRTAVNIRLYLLERRDVAELPLGDYTGSDFPTAILAEDRDKSQLAQWARESDAIVDAIFGIGARLPLTGGAREVLQCVSDCLRELSADGTAGATFPARPEQGKSASRPFVFAIDCPSGVDCDSGKADAAALSADLTLTFVAAKPGLFVFPAAGLRRRAGRFAYRHSGRVARAASAYGNCR